MAPGRNPNIGAGDGYQYEPAEKRRRTDRSPSQSSSAAVGSEHSVANTSTLPPSRQQERLTGTPSALWRSRRPSADSLEDYFARIDTERGPAPFPSYQRSAGRELDLSDLDPSGALIAHLLGDRHPSAPMDASRSSLPGDHSLGQNDIDPPTDSMEAFGDGLAPNNAASPTGSNPEGEISAGEFYAAFAVSDDELARIGPARVPDLGDAEMPGPSGVHQQHVISTPSPGSEFDEGWDSYCPSESEDEAGRAVDPGSIETMDMAELGRRPRTPPRPAPTYYEVIQEAERLEASITQNELDEFFSGEPEKEFVLRKPLALLRVLDLHGVSKLSDLQYAPKAPGDRRIDLEALACGLLDAMPEYFKRVYFRVLRYIHKRNDGAPAWMYTIAERFSLGEGRRLQRLLNMPAPSNAGAGEPGLVSPFDETLTEAKLLESSITLKELRDSFGGKIFTEPTQRALLALERALALRGVSKLGDLKGAPRARGGRRLDRELLEIKLGLRPGYFLSVRHWMLKYYRNGKPTPTWMWRIIDTFSLNEGREPIPRIEPADPSPRIADRPRSHPPVQTMDLQRQPNAGEANSEGETLYFAMIKESKPIRPLITDSEIEKFFGDLKKDSDGIRRNILALIHVLDEHQISKLKDVPGAPTVVRRANISSAKVSDHLDLKKGYFEMLRANVRRREIKNNRAPEWMYKVLERFSLDDGLLGELHGASGEGNGDIDDVPEPSNAGVFHENAAPTYHEVLESAKALAQSISNKAVLDYFKQFRYPDVIDQRKVLAFVQALKKHRASRLDALVGHPAGAGGGVKLKEVATELKLGDVRYFDRLVTTARRYQKNGKPVPEWIKDVMDKLSVDRRENRKV
jgi:hypothetical protein